MHVAGAIASFARGMVIAFVALLCVIAYTAGSLRRLAIRDRAARARHRQRQRGQLLRWSFTRLGATFVKIGQVASSRPDLLSPGVIEALRTLQDRVPSFPFRRVRRRITRELGGPPERFFREIDETPVAAGGIAQVHRAVLHSGEEVAVKVVRPHVHARVHRDALLLLWLAHVAHALSARARAADVIGHTRSLVEGIVAQCELRYEARNYERFRHEFAATRDISFPRVYSEYSTRGVLTMEFVHGVTIDRLTPDRTPHVTRVLREAFFAMCFEHGLVHADLHPGNLLVRDDNVVVLLDLGLVKYLSPHVIEQFTELARCMVMGDAAELVTHLRTHHHAEQTTDWNAVAADATAFIAELRQRSMAEIEMATTIARLFGLARKHHIRPDPELSLVLLGIVTIEGIAKRLEPEANTMVEIARYFAPRMVEGRRLARGTRDWERAENRASPAPAAPAPRTTCVVAPGSAGTGRHTRC